MPIDPITGSPGEDQQTPQDPQGGQGILSRILGGIGHGAVTVGQQLQQNPELLRLIAPLILASVAGKSGRGPAMQGYAQGTQNAQELGLRKQQIEAYNQERLARIQQQQQQMEQMQKHREFLENQFIATAKGLEEQRKTGRLTSYTTTLRNEWEKGTRPKTELDAIKIGLDRARALGILDDIKPGEVIEYTKSVYNSLGPEEQGIFVNKTTGESIPSGEMSPENTSGPNRANWTYYPPNMRASAESASKRIYDTAHPQPSDIASVQQVDLDVNGKARKGIFNPKDGKFYDPDTGTVIKDAKPWRQPPASTLLPPGVTQNDLDDMVKSAAQKVVTGEFTIDQAARFVGKPGYGKLLKEIDAGGSRIVPAPVRDKMTALDQAIGLIDNIEPLLQDVLNAKSPQERIKTTALLQSYTQSIGTALFRGVMQERGVITDQDVARATGLVPGWKAANFAPEYAEREVALLRKVAEIQKEKLAGSYFSKLPAGGKPKAEAEQSGSKDIYFDKNGNVVKQ